MLEVVPRAHRVAEMVVLGDSLILSLLVYELS